MIRMNFSQKLVFAYTCIVVIPLFIIVVVAMGLIRRSRVEELEANSEGLLQENYELVQKNIETFSRFEQLVNSNGRLTLFFTIPERSDEEEIIDTMISEAAMLERTIETVPNIYGLRIFSDNPNVPERWPIFMNSSRTNVATLNKWEFNYTADYLGNLGSLKYESVCTTRRLEKNFHPIGYVQIAMKTSDFFPFLFKKINEYNDDYAFREVLNKQTNKIELIPITNEIIERSRAPFSQGLYDEFYKTVYRRTQGELAKGGKVILRDKNSIRYSSWIRVPEMNIILLHTCSAQQIQRSLLLIQVVILLGLTLTVFLLYFLVRYLTSRLMGRVYNLIGGMKQVQSGNLNAIVEVTGTDEVTEAQQTFNIMTEQLRSQIDEIKKEQQLIADTEMKAMQNQINAHFLYNALETIKMQAVIAGETDVEESINVLGKLMHYCLRWRVHTVKLEEEVDYIRSYIYLLNIRNDYVISLETEIQPEWKTIAIPKMSLQPLVENAFNYAIEPLGKDAVIRVYTENGEQEDRIWLCVRDFGKGINKEKQEELAAYLADDNYERDSTGSIGLKNIQQRLTMFCGKDYRLVIESTEGEGTLIKIPVPRNYLDDSGAQK
ncbi:two-component system, sensor histidine kinase YesM [Treponema bryantii]|uniref:Two-component system, sensor histidine kinase YesM n=2 Tax=Treponema bryantii TaxID=163 RepID=A0A1I3HUW6_9SPIR|nr:two-component system, sensor histidine kinase YesM [Treponema bryantii]